MVNNEFDAYNGPTYRAWLTQAYQHAANKSKDKSTQLAALLVHPEQGLVAAAVNEFPKRIEVTDERLERPAKYEYTEHAERNVIFRCAERGFSTSGLIMYCPWYSCIDCSRAIIQAGIKEVVGHKEMYNQTPDHWNESVDKGIAMLEEAGIRTVYWSGKIGNDISVRMNGELFYP